MSKRRQVMPRPREHSTDLSRHSCFLTAGKTEDRHWRRWLLKDALLAEWALDSDTKEWSDEQESLDMEIWSLPSWWCKTWPWCCLSGEEWLLSGELGRLPGEPWEPLFSCSLQMVCATLREMSVAWRVPPRASRWIAGGSWDLDDPDLEDLIWGLEALAVELEGLRKDIEEVETSLSLATKEWRQWPLPPLLRSCVELGATTEEEDTDREAPSTNRLEEHHPWQAAGSEVLLQKRTAFAFALVANRSIETLPQMSKKRRVMPRSRDHSTDLSRHSCFLTAGKTGDRHWRCWLLEDVMVAEWALDSDTKELSDEQESLDMEIWSLSSWWCKTWPWCCLSGEEWLLSGELARIPGEPWEPLGSPEDWRVGEIPLSSKGLHNDEDLKPLPNPTQRRPSLRPGWER